MCSSDLYYATERYDEAVPYLKRYMEQSYRITREDQYQLGYSYYKSSDYDNAISYLKLLVREKDEIAQNAYYLLGSSYINMDEQDGSDRKKKFARFAFRSAAKMDFDKKIQEDANYNYAKLSYELGINSIYALKNYIDKYPDTQRAEEAYEYLVKVYLTTNNYKKALKSLEHIKDKNPKMQAAYQRIAFFRGVELFNDGKLTSAIVSFNKSLEYGSENKIQALNYYWKGEVYYRLQRYGKAIENYNKFIYAPTSFDLSFFNEVNYNLGYSYFNLGEYNDAITWFRKFVRDITAVFRYVNVSSKDSSEVYSKAGDAYLRIGDSYFIQKDYVSAIEYYDKAIGLPDEGKVKRGIKTVDIDYALFQKGMALGVLGKQEEKTKILLVLLKDYSTSAYIDDSKYELGKSYTLLEQNDSAIAWYNRLVNGHPKSSYVKKALLNTGLVYCNIDENEIALVTFKDRKSVE